MRATSRVSRLWSMFIHGEPRETERKPVFKRDPRLWRGVSPRVFVCLSRSGRLSRFLHRDYVFSPRFSEHRNETFGKGNVVAKIERVGFTRQVSNLFSELTIVGFRWQVDGSLMGSFTILYSAAIMIASSFLQGYDVLWFRELMSSFLRFFWYELFSRLRININGMFEKITFAFVVWTRFWVSNEDDTFTKNAKILVRFTNKTGSKIESRCVLNF